VLARRCSVERPGTEPQEGGMTYSGGGDISGFLARLHEDADLQTRYKQDPRGTLKEAGLSDEEVETILSGDLGKIKGWLERELPGASQMLFMIVTDPET
jgi:hypothetical protein